MAFSDLFSVSFLVSLGITLLLTGLLGMFLVQKIQEQNHKMASMLGLVSTMAEELNFMRGRMQMMSYVPQPQQGGLNNQNQNQNQMESVNLIPVSDGDTSEDDSDTEDEDTDDDDSSEDEDDISENEDEEVQQFIELNPNAQSIKVINFSNSEDLENEDIEELHDVDDLNDLDDADNDNDDNEDDDDNDENDTNEENDNTITLHNVESELENNDIAEQTKNLIKTIDIDVSTLEETTTIDYRKMSLNKLKSIAVNKGLITESDKVTKNALLKMLKAE